MCLCVLVCDLLCDGVWLVFVCCCLCVRGMCVVCACFFNACGSFVIYCVVVYGLCLMCWCCYVCCVIVRCFFVYMCLTVLVSSVQCCMVCLFCVVVVFVCVSL